jgi:hypothetical protein
LSTRASIILWSAGSGVLLGLFIDAVLVGLWALAATAIPSLSARSFSRWTSVAVALLLASIPLAGAVLGYLEGRLKVR